MRTPHELVICPTGRTVWVNSSTDGSCIGRFSKRFGMDIHKTGTQQMNGEGECIHCTHSPGSKEDWELFVKLMKQHYDIEIPIKSLRYS
jgi:hypothetical protein